MASTRRKVQTTTRARPASMALTGANFQHLVCNLWKRTKGKPKDPTAYFVPQPEGSENTGFPLEAEVELAEGLAYIVAVKKGVESVSASAIGIPNDPHDGLLIYIASNDGVRSDVQDHLRSIVSAIQEVASREVSKDVGKDRILTVILEMNSGRINARLKARKNNRPIVLQGLQEILANIAGVRSSVGNLTILRTRLTSLCQSLQDHAVTSTSSSSVQNLKTLVLACHEFWAAPGSESTRGMLLRVGVDVNEMQGNPYLLQIAKIAAFDHTSRMIVVHASNRKFEELFRHVTVQYVPTHDPIQTVIPTTIAGGGNQCRVHAEAQLVIELDTARTTEWRAPRTIGSSKAACFLCDLFMRKHGAYFVPRSHGLLTPFWTIPNSDRFTRAQRQTYRGVIDAMSEEIIRLANSPHPHRLHPAMSWQALSRLGALHYSRELSRFPTPTPSIRSICVPSILSCVTGKQPLSSQLAVAPKSVSKSIIVDSRIEESIKHPSISWPEVNAATETLPELQTPEGPNGSDLSGAKGDTTYISLEGRTPDESKPRETERIQPFHDLNSQQNEAPADTIGDHENRTCNVSPAYNVTGVDRKPNFDRLYVDSTNWKLNFHDFELFFEFDRSTTATICVVPDENPGILSSRVIDATALDYGHEVVVDFEASEAKGRVIFLRIKTGTNAERWLKLTWADGGEEEK